jgi:hypothetical protein
VISLEDDHEELQRRIKGVLDHFGVDRCELKGWLFCATPIGSKLAETEGKKRVIGRLERQIRDAIVRRQPLLVALDPFVKLHSLNENDSGDMNFVCDLLVRLAVDARIAVDIPHHVHKGSIAPGDADAGRGSSGIRDAGRLTYTLTPMAADEAKMFGVETEDRFDYVRLDSAKVNIARRGGKAAWFHIVGVPINNGTPDYPNGDTIQVAIPWAPPSVWAGIDTQILNTVLDKIDAGLPGGERYSAAPTARDRHAWRVIQSFARHKTEEQCRMIVRQWVKSGVLVEEIYHSEKERKERLGVRVANSARPGTKTEDFA